MGRSSAWRIRPDLCIQATHLTLLHSRRTGVADAAPSLVPRTSSPLSLSIWWQRAPIRAAGQAPSPISMVWILPPLRSRGQQAAWGYLADPPPLPPPLLPSLGRFLPPLPPSALWAALCWLLAARASETVVLTPWGVSTLPPLLSSLSPSLFLGSLVRCSLTPTRVLVDARSGGLSPLPSLLLPPSGLCVAARRHIGAG